MSAVATLDPIVRPMPAWECPAVRPGDTVQWFKAGQVNDSPAVGWVLSLGWAKGRTIKVFVIHPNGQPVLYNGVRHVDDPDAKGNPEKMAEGGWRHMAGGMPETLNMFQAYAAKVADLEQRIAALEKKK